MSDVNRRPWIRVLTVVSAIAAVALVSTHLALDAGAAEAPRWILYLAMAAALIAAELGSYGGNRDRQRR